MKTNESHCAQWLVPAAAALIALGIGALWSLDTLAQSVAGEPEAVLVGAGDIATCRGPASESIAAKTAALIEKIPGTVFATGDLAYEYGSEKEFKECYDPTWGRFKDRTLPAPGNHEYLSANAAPYYAYWGRAAGEPGNGYYSVQLGNWRVISLNSNIDVGAGSKQEQWLRNELKTYPARCTLAFWHHPFTSSGSYGYNPNMRYIFQALYEAGIDVVINGHAHVYERLAPHDAQEQADPARGIRVFVVGTGGGIPLGFDAVLPISEARQRDVFGVLKLTLRSDGYSWDFIPIEGQTFHDAGEGKCHG
jgi:calcineurin-like phosphoesterase family protein